jgi:hypothetical protein
MKLSVAFGGHMAAMVLRRWDEAESNVAFARRAA